VIRQAVSTLAEFSGLGAAVLYHAAPPSRREEVYRALRGVADNPVSRWPSALALAVVGAGWKAARWLL
jgi:hypothetical protein